MTASAVAPKLCIAGLRAGYSPDKPVLESINLSLDVGEILCLTGPNGSGKSTLLKAIAGSIGHSAGKIELDGVSRAGMKQFEFARTVAVVPQDTSISFDISCLDVVLLGRRPYGSSFHLEDDDDRAIAMECLLQTECDEFADRSILTLSGGQRQRVMLAKALAQQPSLLLLDEPTANLDIAHQTRALSLVKRLSEQNQMSVIAVLHDLNLAASWSQRMVVMNQGKIVADGDPVDVMTEALISKVWHTRMWVKRHPATGRPYCLPAPPPYEASKHDNTNKIVHVICGGGSGGPVLAALMEAGFGITCGVVNIGDSDEEMCRAMNIPHVSEAPFSPISDEGRMAGEQMIADADALLVTPFCVGSGNIANIQMALAAARSGKQVLLIEDQERLVDYTGGMAEALFSELRELASIVGTSDRAINALHKK